ncbi:uncharacterized protein LOC126830183 [Patella vulgata]|uniref:uncharacterized protein LOC126830183 n=1 Tax=Patella vulgata TaxID=6465 RepID=UPI0024A9F4EF|nr:uncharacterized protein LOC126830183 [Patella vulgata]XP_050416454.2 uncharacterized protein LOC126830183 [Patella vulgata]XP_050416455.2 uncharacterized protein LOC126830183 [Patella vulgata]
MELALLLVVLVAVAIFTTLLLTGYYILNKCCKRRRRRPCVVDKRRDSRHSFAVDPHLHDNGHCFRDYENEMENGNQFPQESTLHKNNDCFQEDVEISDSRSDTVFIEPETFNDVNVPLRSQSRVVDDVTSRNGSSPTEERYPRLSNIQRLIDYRLNRQSSQCSLSESQQDLLKAVSTNIQTIISKGYLIGYKPHDEIKQYIENSSTDFNVIDEVTESYKVMDKSTNSTKSRLSEPFPNCLNLEEDSFSRRIKDSNMSTPKELQSNGDNATLSLTEYPTLPLTDYPTLPLNDYPTPPSTDYPTLPLSRYPVNRQSLCSVGLSLGIEDSGLFSNASIDDIFHQQVSYDHIRGENITETFYQTVDGYQLDESGSEHIYQSINSLWTDVLARRQNSSQTFNEPVGLRQSGDTDDVPYYLQPLNTLERQGCQETGTSGDNPVVDRSYDYPVVNRSYDYPVVNRSLNYSDSEDGYQPIDDRLDCPDKERDVENRYHPGVCKHLETGESKNSFKPTDSCERNSNSDDSYEPIDLGPDCPNKVSQNSDQHASIYRRDCSVTESVSRAIDQLIDAVSTDDASEAGHPGADGDEPDDTEDENYYNGFDSSDPLIGERRVCRFYPVRKVYTISPRRNYNFHPNGDCGSVLIDFSQL